ncbi:phage portal protein [Streptomyces sp. NE06-03C]|uniref:phage portal protein n=1 Tax=Streptomyces sp. NE06-03C TaxID=3028694 RepID=UPI0029A5EF9B|nr:phage portal protein [Streptomyces sp. NE06-03C]MDX2922071.1 phage portal protein [Streptomyces sp. NE06-03C]
MPMPHWARRITAPFRRVGQAALRAITSVPWGHGGPGNPAEVSASRALTLIPVFASVRLIADNVASLPLQLFRRDGADRQPVSYVPDLFWKPDVQGDLFTWLHKCVLSMALRGNAYGLVTQRDQLGFPTMVEWLNPDDVWVDEYNPVKPKYYWQGRFVEADRIVHIPWVVLPGKVVGLSPVALFAHTIGAGLMVTEYGRSWFTNGGTPPAVLRNGQKTVGPEESEEISDRLASRMRSRKPLVIGSDWEFEALKVSPEESQFIESMRLNATQIAAIYGVPPEKVGGESGGSLTYSTVEMNSLDLINTTLRPWLVRLEGAFTRLMPGREYVRFNADAMLRTSVLDRYTAHGMALAQGWRNKDEVRAMENLSPLPSGAGGEVYGPVAAISASTPPAQEGDS